MAIFRGKRGCINILDNVIVSMPRFAEMKKSNPPYINPNICDKHIWEY